MHTPRDEPQKVKCVPSSNTKVVIKLGNLFISAMAMWAFKGLTMGGSGTLNQG